MDALLLAQLLNQIPKPTEDNPDYNLPAYVKKYGVPDQSKGQHLTDEFKLPNHMTFSDSSSYSAPDIQGGKWQQGGQNLWNFSASPLNEQMHSRQQLIDYFKNVEKGNILTMPDGKSYR